MSIHILGPNANIVIDREDPGLVLFGKDRPESMFMSQLYDPDKHGLDPTKSGKIVPRPGSLVIDDVNKPITGVYVPYVVVKVSSTTYESTLAPLHIISSTGEGDDKTTVVSYGNDIFELFFDDRVRPTFLLVDNKLTIFGDNNVEYRLMKTFEDGSTVPISVYLDSDENCRGDRIPLTSVPGNVGAKKATNCHTLVLMVPGDTITMEVFNSAGIMTCRIPLVTARVTLLNDLLSSTNPIVDFDAEADQMRGDQFFVYEKQDPEHIGIRPIITYADGTQEIVSIDSKTCFAYGLDDLVPAYSGQERKILIKKFLSHMQPSLKETVNARKERFLTVEKVVKILTNSSTFGLKLSVVPKWNTTDESWELMFFAYTERRDKVYDVTPLVKLESPFDGKKFATLQHITVNLNLSELFDTVGLTLFRQSFIILVRQFNLYEKYNLRESENDDFIYGLDTSSHRRPIIHYDTTLKQYFVPTSSFPNKNEFVYGFYKVSRPPYNTATETKPVEPTHFTVRSASTGNVLLASPIEVEQYAQIWNAVLPGMSEDALVGTNVLVEFLQLVGSEYTILYGAPVDVMISKTGYNVK